MRGGRGKKDGEGNNRRRMGSRVRGQKNGEGEMEQKGKERGMKEGKKDDEKRMLRGKQRKEGK